MCYIIFYLHAGVPLTKLVNISQVLHVLFSGQPLYNSCGLRIGNEETMSGIHSAQRQLEGMPASPNPIFNTSSTDASCCITPVACQVPTSVLHFSPEPISPSLQSILATPSCSAFTRVVQEPACTQPDEANSNKSPHKASCDLSYMKYQFFHFVVAVDEFVKYTFYSVVIFVVSVQWFPVLQLLALPA